MDDALEIPRPRGRRPLEQARLEQAAVTLHEALRARRLRDLRLPNLIGVGSARSGSTYLYELLRLHPDVYAAPNKELNYFGILSRNAMTLREYTLMFLGQGEERYVAEVTPVYMHSERSMREMAKTLERPKILITLREPVSRLISHYRHYQDRHGFDALEPYLAAAVDGDLVTPTWPAPSRALMMSTYATAVGRAFDLFGRDNCLVLNHADLADGPETWMAQIGAFLDIDMGSVQPRKTVIAQHPADLPASDAGRRIVDMFLEDRSRLEALLGQAFLSKWSIPATE